MIVYIQEENGGSIVRGELRSASSVTGRVDVNVFPTMKRVSYWADQICGVDIPSVEELKIQFGSTKLTKR